MVKSLFAKKKRQPFTFNVANQLYVKVFPHSKFNIVDYCTTRAFCTKEICINKPKLNGYTVEKHRTYC